MPVVAPIVAIAVLLLVHVPPVAVLVSVVEEPIQTAAAPVIEAGNGFTVNDAVRIQPAVEV
jgi:hypothetical protein